MEFIGLALGIAPLFIELLKAKPEPVHALKATNKESAKEMMAEFYRDLHYEVTMLRITLTGLVNELPIKADLKEKLTNEKSLGATVWKKPPPELQSALERRLSPCYDSFVHSMEKVLKLLESLVDDKSLPLALAEDEARDCTNAPYARLEEFFETQLTMPKRLKFGWRKDKRDKIMRGFAKYNKRLEDMLKRTLQTGTGFIPPKRGSTATCTPHLGLRQKMRDLRRAIGQAWCQCVGKHELRFGLSKTWKSSDHVRLDMIMNLSKDHTKWHWGESKISIHLGEMDDSPSGEHRRTSRSFTSTTLVGSPEKTTRRESQDAALRNASINTLAGDDEGEEVTDDPKWISGTPHGKIFVLKDICATVQKAQKAGMALQLTFYQDLLSHNATTTETEVPHAYLTHPGECLRSCLQNGKLTMKDRKILQVLLAQSVLFFPWEGQHLNKTSIVFHHNLSKPFAAFLPDHGDDPADVFGNLQVAELEEFKPYNNEILAALATTLLEIELQKSIEELQTEQGAGDDDDDDESSKFVTNFWTTTRVLKEQESNMFKDCYAAIDACLRCDFEGDSSTLDDPNVLRQVYEQIVEPLERELEHGFKLRMPYLGDIDEANAKVSQTASFARSWHKPRQQKSVKIIDDTPSKTPEVVEIKKIRRAVTIASPTTMIA